MHSKESGLCSDFYQIMQIINISNDNKYKLLIEAIVVASVCFSIHLTLITKASIHPDDGRIPDNWQGKVYSKYLNLCRICRFENNAHESASNASASNESASELA